MLETIAFAAERRTTRERVGGGVAAVRFAGFARRVRSVAAARLFRLRCCCSGRFLRMFAAYANTTTAAAAASAVAVAAIAATAAAAAGIAAVAATATVVALAGR